jgi:pimeloyl-ACP methyl ester carboxylesterase
MNTTHNFQMTPRSVARAMIAVAALALGFFFDAAHAAADPALGAIQQGPPGREFYFNVPASVPAGAKRGDIYWMRKREDAPAGSEGWRMIYVTEGVGGALTYTGGEIFVPTAAGNGERRIALWNHPTTGNQDACAPSWAAEPSIVAANGRDRIPAVAELLKRGYVVVTSDYQGLGTPGGTSYMDGPLDAKASLDAVRAARNFSHARVGTRLVQWGHSQGGQTTLWVASLARTYAPEFEVLGSLAIAPAVNTLGLTEWDIRYPPMGAYLVTTVAGLQVSHPELRLRDILTPAGLELLSTMANGCFAARETVQNLKEPVAKPEALAPGQPWRTMFDANDNFYSRQIATPVLIYQGGKDMDVPVDLTRAVNKQMCAMGNKVEYRELAERDHINIVLDARAAVPDWFDDRFASKPAGNTC